MEGHGVASDGSGRLNVNVQIAFSGEGSWNDDSTGLTNTNIWNGVHAGALDWNNQAINHKFNVNQAADSSDVDIRIVKGDPGKGRLAKTVPTEYNTNPPTWGPPYTMTLPAAAANWSPAKLQAVIAHELSHPLGLADVKKYPTCGHTIMNHATRVGDIITGSVQAKDVATANKHYNDRSTCSTNLLLTLAMSAGGGYTDPAPVPSLYPRTCYNYWTAYDIYDPCDCSTAGEYLGTIYVLTNVICY
jgi:hypothetical protein